jgi:hypothetical protein
MVSATRWFFAIALLLCSCEAPQPLPVSKRDHTTRWWGDTTRYGSRQHYVHVVRDQHGEMKEVYRYYLDERGQPVLDGERTIYRWQHDPGHILLYRDGRVIRENDAIVTG